MTTPRVFIPNQPTGRDPDTGRVRPSIDLSPAMDWGHLVFLLGDTDNPLTDPQGCAERMRVALLESHFGLQFDRLLLVGNPILIGLMTTLAADLAPSRNLCFLQWKRAAGVYHPVRVCLDQKTLAAGAAAG